MSESVLCSSLPISLGFVHLSPYLFQFTDPEFQVLFLFLVLGDGFSEILTNTVCKDKLIGGSSIFCARDPKL